MQRLFAFLLLVCAGNIFGASSSSSASLQVIRASWEKKISPLQSQEEKLRSVVNENKIDLRLATIFCNEGIERLKRREPKDALKSFAAALNTCEGKPCEVLIRIYIGISRGFFLMGKTVQGCYYAEQAGLTTEQYKANLKARKRVLTEIVEMQKLRNKELFELLDSSKE